MHKPNHLLEFDVKDTLDWDSTIDDRRIEVKADDGHVTLDGLRAELLRESPGDRGRRGASAA